MVKFLKLLLKNELKDYIVVIIAFSIFFSFEFVIWNLFFCIDNNTISFSEKIFFNFSTIALIMIIFMMILFINNFFTNTKKQEFSIILLSGRKTKDIMKFLSIQYGAIFLISNILSIFIGELILKMITLYMSINFKIILQYNVLKSFGMFFLINIISFMYVIMINFGIFVRLQTKIITLMSNKVPQVQTLFIDRLKIQDNHSNLWISKYKNIIQLIINILIIVVLCFSLKNIFMSNELIKKISSFILAIFCLMLFVDISVPYVFDVLHRYFLNSIVLLASCSNIIYMTKSMIFIINLSGILIPIIVGFLTFFTIGTFTKIYIIIYIAITLIILFISLIFKMSLLIDSKRAEIKSLETIGVNNKQLHRIKIIEVNIFYLLSVIIPMLFSFLLLYSGVYNKMIELDFAILISLEYLLGSFISYIVINYQYIMIYGKRRND